MTRFGFRLAMVALLTTHAVAADNVLRNADFANGIDDWQLESLTRIIGFHSGGAIDLATMNPATGGITQCINGDRFAAGLRNGDTLEAAIVATILGNGSNRGGAFLLVGAFSGANCSGTLLDSARGEPPVDTNTGSPLDIPIAIRAELVVPPGAQSIHYAPYAFAVDPASEFRYRLHGPLLKIKEETPTGAPDLAITLREAFTLRTVVEVIVSNVGTAPTTGPYSINATARDSDGPIAVVGGTGSPFGDRGCSSFGSGTVCVYDEPLAPGSSIGAFVNLLPGSTVIFAPLTVNATVTGGGDTYLENNEAELVVESLRAADPIGNDEPARVRGRGRP